VTGTHGVKTFLLFTGLTLLFLLVGDAVGGRDGMVVALLMAAAAHVVGYWFSDQLVLAAYRAHPVGLQDTPELYGMVEELCLRADMPMPQLYIIDDDTPNAFATGRNPAHAAVAVTTGLLERMDEQQVAGVIAHELGHILNRDILVATLAATLAGAVTALVAWLPRREGGANPLLLLLAPVAAMVIQMAVSRAREYAADEMGARLCGEPLWLASALRQLESDNRQLPSRVAAAHPATAHLFIVNPLSGLSLLSTLFSTHPPIEKRVYRLEVMAGQR
jgi:heat shock protein HtpX